MKVMSKATSLLREAIRLAGGREGTRGAGTVYRQNQSRFWWIQYWRDGKRYRESSRTESRREAEKLLRAKVRGEDPSA